MDVPPPPPPPFLSGDLDHLGQLLPPQLSGLSQGMRYHIAGAQDCKGAASGVMWATIRADVCHDCKDINSYVQKKGVPNAAFVVVRSEFVFPNRLHLMLPHSLLHYSCLHV
jgi:hypothetical protein